MSRKRVIFWLRRQIFRHSDQYSKLRKVNDASRFILLSDIDHGNLGDHAIIYAINKLIESINQRDNLISLTRTDCINFLEDILQWVRTDDIILVPGGGWVGTLWEKSGELFITILEKFKDNKIVVFPQTICFLNDENGRKQKERLFRALENCRDIDLFVRDPLSYAFLEKEMPKESKQIKYALLPDMVLSLQATDASIKRQNKILWILRKDRESTISNKTVAILKEQIEKKDCLVICADTVLPYHVKPKDRYNELRKLWRKYSESKLVITDRLHGMLFAVITSTPCIAVDNSSHKVQGVYNKWLGNSKNIFLVDESSSLEMIQKFIDVSVMNDCETYNPEIFNDYFNKIVDTIEGKTE